MIKPLPDRIAAAKAKRDKLDQRLRNMEAKAKKDARDLATRRKIIVGAAVLVEMERTPRFATFVREMLAKAITRPQDRAAIPDLLQPASPELAASAVNSNTTSTPPPAAEVVSAGFAVTAREKLTG